MLAMPSSVGTVNNEFLDVSGKVLTHQSNKVAVFPLG